MNTVIIVGGDHHNGLNLARAFGEKGIKVHSVVIGETPSSFLAKSIFVSQCVIRQDDKLAFDYIKENYSHMNEKPVLIPYSDSAAKELDFRLDEFKDDFYFPSINGKQGEISSLMDKENQYRFACEHQIKMAKSMVVYMAGTEPAPSDFPMPCILKPVVSAEGDKRDIAVCSDGAELGRAIAEYREKGYHRALLQEYLRIDYEIDMFGCVLRHSPYLCLIPTHTFRSWPPKGGTNSFSQIITDPTLVKQCTFFVDALRDCGFYGLYDIELFVVGNDLYLNEFNLRNSGDVYMGLHQKYYYPVAWYNDILGIENTITSSPEKDSFCMTECADVRHVFGEKYSLFAWYKEYRKCKDYALQYKGDMRPARAKYWYYVKKLLRKGK